MDNTTNTTHTHKVVELEPAEFQKLLLKIKDLEKLVEELRNANTFLNNEIRQYNKEWSGHEKTIS